MNDFNEENIKKRYNSENKISDTDNTPVYSSRLEKYHSKETRKSRSENKRRSKSRLITAEDLDIDIPDKYDTKDQPDELNLKDDNSQDTRFTDNDSITPLYEDEISLHKRSSKDADINIQKLIDLDEGDYTNRFKKQGSEKHMSRAAKAWLISLLCVGIAICLVLVFVIEIVSIEGQSMEPTLFGGEKIIAEKLSRYFEFPSKGQVVVTKYDGYDGYYVKRLIALPGEWVEIYDNKVYINGEELDEPYINSDTEYEDMPLMQVPEGCVFLLGDNRAQSLDSRMDSIGPVKAENLIGNAWCVILPFEDVRLID